MLKRDFLTDFVIEQKRRHVKRHSRLHSLHYSRSARLSAAEVTWLNCPASFRCLRSVDDVTQSTADDCRPRCASARADLRRSVIIRIGDATYRSARSEIERASSATDSLALLAVAAAATAAAAAAAAALRITVNDLW